VPLGRTVVVNEAATYIDCRGSGSPTVILDSGLGTGAAGWGSVLGKSAEISRTCTWDRPGIGASASIGRHDAIDLAAHLRATLSAAGESGPFVVVGHSLGGVYARVFAAAHAAEVAGIVLVDPYAPDIRAVDDVALPEDLRDGWTRGIDETNDLIEQTEELDWAATERALADSDLGDLPLELLFVEQRFRWEGPFEPYEPQLIAAWEDLVLALSADARLTIAVNSTHMIQWDQPERVVEAIRRLVDEARATR
jgi:pimeloyl-ACP methyl ester carboxylesterase